MKPEGYFASDRGELVRQLPTPIGRVLDVGCGEGRTAVGLRQAGATRIVGIELESAAAAAAAESYDEVREGPVESELDRIAGPFDTILLYDILEHLIDPWELFASAARGRRARRQGARLDSQRAALDAPARPRAPRHVRLHACRAPRCDTSPLVHAT